MFQLAISIPKRLILAGVVVGMVSCALTAGGAAWWWLKCDVNEYLYQATVIPLNPNERSAFACGYVWHSTDAGRTWRRMDTGGLPFGTRDGVLTADRQPGTFYLGIQMLSSSSIYCWNCAWTIQRSAVYVSTDSGRTWAFAYKFRRGPAGVSGFLGLYADPLESGAVWAVVRNGDEISYYGSRTGAKTFSRTCFEFYFVGSNGCRLPKHLQSLFGPETTGGGGVD